MLRDTPLSIGTSAGTIYDFDNIGDILDMHSHTESDVHYTIIARGSFRVWGDDFDQTVSAGAILDWQPGVNHGFSALEPNSRLVNIIKYR